MKNYTMAGARIPQPRVLLHLVLGLVASISVAASAAINITLSPDPVCVGNEVTVTVKTDCENVTCGSGSVTAQVGGDSIPLQPAAEDDWTTWVGSWTPVEPGYTDIVADDGCDQATASSTIMWLEDICAYDARLVQGSPMAGTSDWCAVMLDPVEYAGYVVHVQADVIPYDESVIASLSWSGGGSPDPEYATRKLVDGTHPAKTTLTASLCGRSLTLNLWVIWAEISYNMQGTVSPDDTAYFPSYYDGNGLGTITQSGDPRFTACVGAGKIELGVQLYPSGVHNLPLTWSITQSCCTKVAMNGIAYIDESFTEYFEDGPSEVYNFVPNSSDRIYGLDGPGVGPAFFLRQDLLAGDCHTTEAYDVFQDYVTWDGQRCSRDRTEWRLFGAYDADANAWGELIFDTNGALPLPGLFYLPR